MTKIFVVDGSDEVSDLEFSEDVLFIGRSPENDIQITDGTVSRKHLKILRKAGKYFVKDLESKNGTFVDGKHISAGGECEVQEGVPIVIGMTVICIGEGCSEDVLSLLGSMEVSGGVKKKKKAIAQKRPMTAKKNMELIYRVSSVLMQSSDLNEILEKILDSIFDLLKRIDRGMILLVDQKTGEISEAVSRARGKGGEGRLRYDVTVVERVIEENKGMIILDIDAEEETDLSATLKLLKIGSLMCVPLISKSKVRGAIYVDSIDKAHGFRKEDLDLLTALSGPSALAIENALLSENPEEYGDEGEG
ncbi:MAG: FHA domain-containing protein [Deltaproteobacteria bacterium]|nr:FHA domain-containing protein [Deltaproteobacteria bacterium]MBW2205800.1 FHA domain-containing protein [Deltaproteobacteria bacterium]